MKIGFRCNSAHENLLIPILKPLYIIGYRHYLVNAQPLARRVNILRNLDVLMRKKSLQLISQPAPKEKYQP